MKAKCIFPATIYAKFVISELKIGFITAGPAFQSLCKLEHIVIMIWHNLSGC